MTKDNVKALMALMKEYMEYPSDVIGGFIRCKKCKRIPDEIGANKLCNNCEKIIEVRKPRVITCFGIADIYERYSRRQEKYFASLPKNGDKIRVTWLPSIEATYFQNLTTLNMENELSKTEQPCTIHSVSCLVRNVNDKL